MHFPLHVCYMLLEMHAIATVASRKDPCAQYSSSCTICTQHSNCRYCMLQDVEETEFLVSSSDGRDRILGRCIDIRNDQWNAPDQYPVIIDKILIKKTARCGLIVPDFLNGYTCLDVETGANSKEYRQSLIQYQQTQSVFLKDSEARPLAFLDSLRQSEDPMPSRLPEDLIFYFFVAPIGASIMLCLLGCIIQHSIKTYCCSFVSAEVLEQREAPDSLSQQFSDEAAKIKTNPLSTRISSASTTAGSTFLSSDLSRFSTPYMRDEFLRSSNFSRINLDDYMEREATFELSQSMKPWNVVPMNSFSYGTHDLASLLTISQPLYEEAILPMHHLVDSQLLRPEKLSDSSLSILNCKSPNHYLQAIYTDYYKAPRQNTIAIMHTDNSGYARAARVLDWNNELRKSLRSNSASAAIVNTCPKSLLALECGSHHTTDGMP